MRRLLHGSNCEPSDSVFWGPLLRSLSSHCTMSPTFPGALGLPQASLCPSPYLYSSNRSPPKGQSCLLQKEVLSDQVSTSLASFLFPFLPSLASFLSLPLFLPFQTLKTQNSPSGSATVQGQKGKLVGQVRSISQARSVRNLGRRAGLAGRDWDVLAKEDSQGIKTGGDYKFVTLSLQVGGMGSVSVSCIYRHK